MNRSRTLVCLVSQAYLNSDTCGREFELAREAGMPILLVPWVPVHTELPLALTSMPRDDSLPNRVRSSGVHAMLRIGRYRSAYLDYVSALAIQMVELGATRTPEVPLHRFVDVPNAFVASPHASVSSTVAVFACVAAGGSGGPIARAPFASWHRARPPTKGLASAPSRLRSFCVTTNGKSAGWAVCDRTGRSRRHRCGTSSF